MTGTLKRLFRRIAGVGEAEPAVAAPPESEPASEPAPPDLGLSAPSAAPEIAAPGGPAAPSAGWLSRLRQGLSKSSDALTTGITDIFTKRKLDSAAIEELEDILIGADLGLEMSARIAAAVAQGRYDRQIDPEEVKAVLAREVAKVLKPVEAPLEFGRGRKPFVVLVVGVNGSGKTTTIGKLGAIARREGLSVMLAACDTFRAAAIEQLVVWGRRIGARVSAREQGADASGLAFDALQTAASEASDVLLIDTAGRLQNKANLMEELAKIVRVLK
jgi:fused signal recognition particle receptor